MGMHILVALDITAVFEGLSVFPHLRLNLEHFAGRLWPAVSRWSGLVMEGTGEINYFKILC